MARATQGLLALETGLRPLCLLASAGRAECTAGAAAPAGVRQGRKAEQAQRDHHRLPIGQGRLKRGQRGYDAGKRILGRRRHIAVDTLGLLLAGVFSRYSRPGRSQGLASEIVRAL